jgi:hypothetical protein
VREQPVSGLIITIATNEKKRYLFPTANQIRFAQKPWGQGILCYVLKVSFLQARKGFDFGCEISTDLIR